MVVFHTRYFILTLVLLLIEVLIAMYVHDAFIRPYVGDFLVVVFLYCLVRSFLKIPVLGAAIAVLLFSFIIETLQYFQFITLLHLQHSTLAKILLGTSFSPADIAVYTISTVTVVMVERLSARSATK